MGCIQPEACCTVSHVLSCMLLNTLGLLRRYCRSRAILARSQLTLPYDKDSEIGKGQLVLDVEITWTLRDFMAIEQ